MCAIVKILKGKVVLYITVGVDEFVWVIKFSKIDCNSLGTSGIS